MLSPSSRQNTSTVRTFRLSSTTFFLLLIFFVVIVGLFIAIYNDNCDDIPPQIPLNNQIIIHEKNILQNKISQNTNTNNIIHSSHSHSYSYPPIPSLIGIGPEKCGTTTLADYISFHPDKISEFVKPLHEPSGVTWEIRMWVKCGGPDLDKTYKLVSAYGSPAIGENKCSPGYYTRLWPTIWDDIRYKNNALIQLNKTNLNDKNTKLKGINKFNNFKHYYYFEKSPMYWNLPHVAYIFGEFFAFYNTKFYAQLRHPLKRLFSFFNHQSNIGNNRKDFIGYINNALNNKHIKKIYGLLSDSSKSIFDIKTSIISSWTDYVYNSGNWFKGYKGNSKDDLGSFIGVGASCYIIQLLFWLDYVPITNIKLVQSEQFFKNESLFLQQFRCYVRSDYEFNSNFNYCLNNLELIKFKKTKLVSASRGKLPPQKSYELLLNNGKFYNVCNKRLIELLNLEEYKSLMMTKFQFDLWET